MVRLTTEGRSYAHPWGSRISFEVQEEGGRLNPPELNLPRAFLPQKRVAGLRTGTCFLSLVLVFCVPVWAQLGIPVPAPVAGQSEVPKDSLGRTTPRGTALGFL